MGLTLSGDELAAWVQESCARQGVPAKVTDLGVVARIAVLLGTPGTPEALGAPAPKRTGGRVRSEPPHDLHPVRIQRAGTGLARTDHDVVDDRFDDGDLAGEVEFGPLSA